MTTGTIFECHVCGHRFIDDTYDVDDDIYSDGSTCPLDGEQAQYVDA